MDLHVGDEIFRVFGLYTPHAMMPDDEVDAVCAPIENDLNSARKKGYRIIIAGDFNAEIGKRAPEDDPETIGDNQMPHRSERGDLLLQWCAYHSFTISNSFGCNDWNMAWTFKNGSLKKQLDYILVDRKLAKWSMNCQVLECLDIGSDHRALVLRLRCTPVLRKRRRKVRNKPVSTYDSIFNRRLHEHLKIFPYDSKCAKEKSKLLHEVMLQSADSSKADEPTHEDPHDQEWDSKIQTLIQKRRFVRDSADLDDDAKRRMRIELGMAIQKVIRRKLAPKLRKMNHVLHEFRDLQRLTHSARPSGARHIVEVEGEDGQLRRERSEIAEVFASFYEDLYKSTITGGEQSMSSFQNRCSGIPPFNLAELKHALKQMKNCKAADSTGLIAEMLKTNRERLEGRPLTIGCTLA